MNDAPSLLKNLTIKTTILLKMIKNIAVSAEQALNGLEKFTMGFGVFIIFAMMATVVYGVVMRYVFNSPVHQIMELTAYMMVALTFLVLAYIQYQRQHVRISFFVIRQSERTQIILGVFTTLCALGIFILLTWGSWEYAHQAWRLKFTSEEAGYPLFPPRLLVPVGSFVMCLRLLADLCHEINSLFGLRAGGKFKTPKKVRMKTEHIH